MRKLKFSLNNQRGVSETGFLILNLGIVAKIGGRNPVSWFLCRYLRDRQSILAIISHIFTKYWRQFKQNFI